MDGKRISQLTPDTSPSTDDYIVTVDGTTLQNKRVDLGSLPVSNPQNDALDLKLNISDNRVELRGVGFPQGVVSAPIGTTYIDTNATNGAVSWVKATGTGPTGWIVSVGDTGWRNITSSAQNGWTTSSIQMRRIGDFISIKIDALNASSMTDVRALALPLGFQYVTGSSPRGTLQTVASPAVMYRYFVDGALNISGATTATPVLYGQVDFTTTQAWPTTLPGTAV